METINCPGCHHHCNKDSLRCDKGRQIFNSRKQNDILPKLISNIQELYSVSKEINMTELLYFLTQTEQKILLELITKLIEKQKS